MTQASGFYCPGWDSDSVNDPPGCKPIPIDSGGFRTSVEKQVVGLTIELDAQNRTVQVRGFANRLAHADERKILERWAKARGVWLF